MLPGKNVAEASDAEKVFFGVHRFGDAVAKQDQRVARVELHAGCEVFGSRDESYRTRTLGEWLGGLAATNKDR